MRRVALFALILWVVGALNAGSAQAQPLELCCACTCDNGQTIACASGPFWEACDAACRALGLEPPSGLQVCVVGVSCGDPELPYSCPASEAAFCNDGLDNEPDGLTDSADPDCGVPAPALSTLGLGALSAVLIGVGGRRFYRMRRRR
jgi:hypothetical protein